MPQRPIKILIGDDHKLFHESLRLVLERKGFDIVGVACTGRQVFDMALNLEPDIVLMDIRMPEMDGLTSLASIKASRSEIKVIILTSYLMPDYLARALALGANGYISKETSADALANAINAVHSGESIVNRDLLQSVFSGLSEATRTWEDADHVDALTEQEVRILILVGEGLNNPAIAEILSVSVNTVKSHLTHIFRKIGVTDRTQAAIWAHRKGLLP